MGHVLRLGDPDTRPEEAIEVLIKTSKCTALSRPPPLKKFAKRGNGRKDERDDEEEDEMDVDEDTQQRDVYAELGMRTDYFLHPDQDEDDEKEKKKDEEKDSDDEDDEEDARADEKGEKVDKEELIRGFKYGSSYAPCAEGQFERLSTRKGMEICGFFTDANVHSYALTCFPFELMWLFPDSTRMVHE